MPSEPLLRQALEWLSDGKPEAAEPLLRQLLAQPIATPEAVAQAARHLAGICAQTGRDDEAIALLQGAVLLSPEDATLWADLASGLLATGALDGSLACYAQCESLGGDSVEMRNDHAVALLRAGHAMEAMHRLRVLLDLQPQTPELLGNLARAMEAVAREQFEAERWEESLESHSQALELFGAGPGIAADPPFPEDHPEAELLATLQDNAGVVLQLLGRLEEAIAAHEQALALAPSRASSHFHLGVALLLTGATERGWREYEWRFRKTPPSHLCARLEAPAWSTASDCRDPVLVVGEQGLGDMLQFLRYIPAAEEQNRRLQLCLPEKLHALARSSGIRCPLLTPAEAEAAPGGRLLPLLSLPLHLASGTEPSTGGSPYLHLPEERRAQWRRRLRRGLTPGERLVGVHWQGNPDVERIHLQGRSLPLELLAPIARLPGVRLLSLQRGFGEEQWRTCSFREVFVDDQEQIAAILDFIEIGAMASSCDLVISSDSAVAHLSGGLGIPTWLLLKQVPDWRWGLSGERTSWYPSLRLFRQTQAGEWSQPIEQIVAQLRHLRPRAAA